MTYESIQYIRLVILLKLIYKIGPLDLIQYDGSINFRVADLIFPFWGVIENFGLPGGIQSYSDMTSVLREKTNYFFWWPTSNKIMSYLGVLIYELGVIGLIVVFIIYKQLVINYNWTKKEIIILFPILCSSIPLGYGLIPFLFASKAFYKK